MLIGAVLRSQRKRWLRACCAHFVQAIERLSEVLIEASLFRHVKRKAIGIETEENALRPDLISGEAYLLQKVKAEPLAARG
jgi:hypothetical protein